MQHLQPLISGIQYIWRTDLICSLFKEIAKTFRLAKSTGTFLKRKNALVSSGRPTSPLSVAPE